MNTLFAIQTQMIKPWIEHHIKLVRQTQAKLPEADNRDLIDAWVQATQKVVEVVIQVAIDAQASKEKLKLELYNLKQDAEAAKAKL